jgi:hypothetical protein
MPPEKTMIYDDHLFLDVQRLYARGWTESLIKKFLGEPDRWQAVDHFRNYSGRRTYFLERIEVAEASDEFGRAYQSSLSRRKIGTERQAAFLAAREETRGAVQAWRQQLTPKDLESRENLAAAADELEAARKRGYRTPHR